MLRITPPSVHHPRRAHRRLLQLPFGTNRLLAAFEGIEGGFAIGSSILLAVSFAGVSKTVLMSTAFISIIVSGFNSSVVKYSSEHYLDELDGKEKKSPFRQYFIPAAIEFICYIAISLITLLPLAFTSNKSYGVSLCVLLTLVLLFLAGLWRGYLLKVNIARDAFESVILGACIILIGLVSGLLIHSP